MASNRDASRDAGIVLLRVFLGLIVLINGWANVQRNEPTAREMQEVVSEAAPDAPFPFSTLGESLIAKQPAPFTWLASWGRTLVGLGLLIGALVRPLGWLGGLGFLTAFFLGPQSAEHWNLMAAVCCVSCALIASGRTYGLDSFLDSALPGWITWRPGGQGGSKSSPFVR